MSAASFRYQRPARLVILESDLRRRVDALCTRWAPTARIALRIWQRAAPWLAAFAVVLAYLLVAAWLENQDLRVKVRELHVAALELDLENAQFEAQISDMAATRDVPLFYVIESGSTREAQDKLQRLAMLVAQQAYALGDAK